MSWQNVVVLAVFVAVCGFIAYIGDLLGRRMGKKRLSLFGLRPRYTAIVTTSITGMLIAVLAITILTFASKEMQQMVLHGAQVIQDLKNAQEESKVLSKDLEKQKALIVQVRKQASNAVVQKEKLAAAVDRADSDLQKLQGNLAQNKASLRRAELSLGKAGTDLSVATRDIANRRAEIKKQQAAIGVQKALLVRLGNQNQDLRERRVIFRSGQEIARKTIYGSQPKAVIRRQVVALFDEASKKASAAGATIGKDNNKAVLILPKKERNGPFLTEAENINAVVDAIAADGGSVVVRILSFGNELEGEQTLVEFMLVFNKLIYPAGGTVASILIDPQSSRGLIFNSLTQFLRTEVRSNAISKGLIPTYDDAGEPSVGSIGYDQVDELVDKVKASSKTVEVRAIAEKDTWSADTLKLRFEVGGSK